MTQVPWAVLWTDHRLFAWTMKDGWRTEAWSRADD
jgi:hypothetical protein